MVDFDSNNLWVYPGDGQSLLCGWRQSCREVVYSHNLAENGRQSIALLLLLSKLIPLTFKWRRYRSCDAFGIDAAVIALPSPVLLLSYQQHQLHNTVIHHTTPWSSMRRPLLRFWLWRQCCWILLFLPCLSSAKKKKIIISLKAHVLQEHQNTYANKQMCCNLSPTTQQKCLH